MGWGGRGGEGDSASSVVSISLALRKVVKNGGIFFESHQTFSTLHPKQIYPLNMDVTGHFESASCVIEVDGSDTLAQMKGRLLTEFSVPDARRVGMRMKGGGDIGDDNLRICDTEMDEGCAVELYCTGANITPGVIPNSDITFAVTLSPCDRYLAVTRGGTGVSVFDTETHEQLCGFPGTFASVPAFSPCGEWISSIKDKQCAEIRRVTTGALEHSFKNTTNNEKKLTTTAWSACGTKLLSCSSVAGLQVWDIATGVVVHEWSAIIACDSVMVVSGDKVAMFASDSDDVALWDYTKGVLVSVLSCAAGTPYCVNYTAVTPNQRFVAACASNYVRVWDVASGECVFEDVSDDVWTDIAVTNDIVAAYSSQKLILWSISTSQQLWCLEFDHRDRYGVALSSSGDTLVYGGEGVVIVDISHLSCIPQ